MDAIYDKAMALGLKGKTLHEFIKQEREERAKQEEREYQDRVRKEEREYQDRVRREECEHEERQKREERDYELRKMELEREMALIRNGNSTQTNKPHDFPFKMPKLAPYNENIDQIDAYLLRFERYAKSAGCDERDYAIRLSALLTGNALEVYSRLADDEAQDYQKVKATLLESYNFTEKGYREKFRHSEPKYDETPNQYIERLSTYLQKWQETSDEENSLQGLRNLIIKEQFVNSCPNNLATHIEEQKFMTVKEMGETAQRACPPKFVIHAKKKRNSKY